MSEAWRQHWLFLRNRLEELAAKYGAPAPTAEVDITIDPSWGPVGSLAKAQLDAATYAHLLALHNRVLDQERARKAVDCEGPELTHDGAPPSDVSATPVHVL